MLHYDSLWNVHLMVPHGPKTNRYVAITIATLESILAMLIRIKPALNTYTNRKISTLHSFILNKAVSFRSNQHSCFRFSLNLSAHVFAQFCLLQKNSSGRLERKVQIVVSEVLSRLGILTLISTQLTSAAT